MYFVRTLLVLILTLSTSLTGVMAEEFELPQEHTQAAEISVSDEAECCATNTESAQACHHAPAIVPALQRASLSQLASRNQFVTFGLLLTGIDLSGPLDPPRSV